MTFNVQNELNKLKIKCPNKDCSQVISYVEAKKHLELCKFTELVSECNFCKETMLTKRDHREIFEHLSKCVLAMILCENCNEFFLRNTFNDHKKYCQKQISNTLINTNSNSSSSQPKTNIQNQLLNSNNNLNYQNSQYIKNNNNEFKNNDININRLNNNNKCNICNANLPSVCSYSTKIAPHICTQPQPQKPAGIYEAQSFYANNIQNQNNFSNISHSNLANSFNPRTFHGNEYQPYFDQFSNQNNKNLIQNNYPKPVYPFSVYNPNTLNSQNPPNTNHLLISHDNYTNKPGLYSNINISNISYSQNINRVGNERYLQDSDRSHLGNNEYLISIEELHKHNKSEIKNLVKNKDIEISQIKKDYENKINAIINKNLDQNQKAKNVVVYEDLPLTLNDLRIDTDRDLINPKKSNNGIDSIQDLNFDKDMSMIEYTTFKNELEKLEEKNFSNSQINYKSPSKKAGMNSKIDIDNNSNNNKFAFDKKYDNILTDDMDLFEFSSHPSFENMNNINNDNKRKNAEIRDKGERKDSKVKEKITQNAFEKEKANEINIEIIQNLNCIEKEKMKKEFEKNIEELKSDYMQQMKDLMQTIKEESANNPKFNKIRYCDEIMGEIKKSVLNKEEEISNYANLQAKYQLLNKEISFIKENYEKLLDKLNKEIKIVKTKNDDKVSQLKQEKQKETLKVIEDNENTILKIKMNYENLISLISNEKDNEIKKLVSKYENDFNILKSKHENSLENLKKDYKNQLEIIKKNFELKDTNSKESNETKIKNIVTEKNIELANVRNDIFDNIQQSFESILIFIDDYKSNSFVENNHKKEIENNEFAKFKYNLQNLVEAKIHDFISSKENFRKIEGERIIEKSKRVKPKAGNMSITDISNHRSDKKKNSKNSNNNILDNNEVIRKLELVVVNEEKHEDDKIRSTNENQIQNNSQNKDNKKYQKIIETIENKMHETKKNLDEIIHRSLNTTLNEINKSYILTEDNRAGGEKESDLSKSHNVKSMSQIKQNRNNNNGENISLTENKSFENVTEKLKASEKLLKEYSNFLEELSIKKNEKIDILIAKSQLEIK